MKRAIGFFTALFVACGVLTAMPANASFVFTYWYRGKLTASGYHQWTYYVPIDIGVRVQYNPVTRTYMADVLIVRTRNSVNRPQDIRKIYVTVVVFDNRTVARNSIGRLVLVGRDMGPEATDITPLVGRPLAMKPRARIRATADIGWSIDCKVLSPTWKSYFDMPIYGSRTAYIYR